MSKKQTSVETSSFGSEFIAMKLCTEYVRGLRYKLRMMGIACEEPTFVFVIIRVSFATHQFLNARMDFEEEVS